MLDKPYVEEIEIYRKGLKETHFYSRFDFLKEHYGIRPGNIHGILGTMGSGKSTLFKAIIRDCSKYNKSLVLLTEETPLEYSNTIPDYENIEDGNLMFINENDIEPRFKSNIQSFYDYLEMKIFESGCDVFFIDNITTGYMYGDSIGVPGQNISAGLLNKLAKKTKKPIFYVAHTTSALRDNTNMMASGESVRGSKQITIVSEYLYSMQKITTRENQYNYIRILKHRHHNVKERTFLLGWQDGQYKFDKCVDYKVLQKILDQRERLR